MSVEAFYPDYPCVRCTSCGNEYVCDLLPNGVNARPCPKCGNERFNTSMTVGEHFAIGEVKNA